MRLRFLAMIFAIAFLGAAWFAKHRPWQSRAANSIEAPTRKDATAEHEPPARAIASDASACLSFYKTVCNKRGPSRDPTGVVDTDIEGEIRALRIYQDVVRSKPEWTLEQVDEELVRRIYTPEAKSRVTSAYYWVRDAIEKWIDSQPSTVFTELDKKRILERIRATKLELPGPAAVYNDERELFTKNDVFYERVSTADKQTQLRMRVGGAFLLAVRSWFNLVFTISHEFGHSIDPCELRSAGVEIPAYDSLSACFLRTGLVSKKEQRKECVANDQLSETFADWLAVKITARALREHSEQFKGQQLLSAARNAVRDLCDPDEEAGRTDSEFHPSPAVRIGRIFGDSPEIRGVLGCPIEPVRQLASSGGGIPEPYCDFRP